MFEKCVIRLLYYYYGEMWLLNKISCEIQILNEKVGKLMIENSKLEEENKKLKEENEYLHKLLPEADGYIIEKQLEKRLWNDGEEDVYEDWGE